MSSGRYTKVVSGYEDVFLTGEPQTSYFSTRYSKNLSTYETYIIEVNILDKVKYGTLLRTVVPEKGDIIKGIIVKMIVPTDHVSLYASYALIEYCDLIIGGQLIDRLTGEYMSLLLDKKCSLTQQNAIATFGTTITNKSLQNAAGLTQLFFEIPFYFFNKLHIGIPICALYKHKIEFNIKIKEWCLLSDTSYYDSVPIYIENKKIDEIYFPLNNVSTLVEYIKLPDEIKERIKNSTMTYTITQTQLQHELIPKYATSFDTKLKFINPVHNLLFYYKSKDSEFRKLYGGNASFFKDFSITNSFSEIIPDSYINRIKELVFKYGNVLSYTNYGTEIPPYINYPEKNYNIIRNCLSHMIDLELKFNGETIIDPDNSGHFLMMNQVHKLMNKGLSNVPMIYSALGVRPDYSPYYYLHNFTENFVSENPGGQVNFSRIRDKDLHINLVPSLYDRSLRIYAQSNNILKVKDGMAGLMFTSPIEYQALSPFMPKSWEFNIIYFDSYNGDPNSEGTKFYGLLGQRNVPYVSIKVFNVYFFNGTDYQRYTELNGDDYVFRPDIIISS